MTPEMLERIEQAYCDANMKCDYDTGLSDARPDCHERQIAARTWLALTGVRVILAELAAQTTRIEALEARERALREALSDIRELAQSQESDLIIACTVGVWANEALAASPGSQERGDASEVDG